MTSPADNQDSNRVKAIALLGQWLQQRIDAEQYDWLTAQLDKSLKSNSGKDLFITLGMIPRKLSRQDLDLTKDELAQAEATRPGWDPSQWSIAGSARIFVAAQLAENGDGFGKQYQELCRTADVSVSRSSFTLPCPCCHKALNLTVRWVKVCALTCERCLNPSLTETPIRAKHSMKTAGITWC